MNYTLEEIRRSDEALNSTPQLKDLYTLITPNYAKHWKIIGTLLDIPEGRLDGIESSYPTNLFWCCNRMLKMWLEMNTSVTWKDVITAIDSLAIPQDVPTSAFPMQDDISVKTIALLSGHVKTNYIQTRYFAQEGIWHHLNPKHFVNTLLIHHMEQRGEKEIVDMAGLMREGLASHKFDTEHTEGSISTHNISDIFRPFKKRDGTTITPEVIIIDGAPGMGKTTLSKEIAYRWAKSQLLNDRILVFFVYLRDPEIKKICDLKSFIHYFYNFDEAAADFSKQCASILINRKNDDIAIILDGYDEYCNAPRGPFISRILKRKVFARCKLIVTSRPTASDRLQHIVDIRVEVMGFTDDSKKEYIEQELKGHQVKIEKLFSYLDKYRAINSICYIPMVMTILVCTFKEMEELPSDQTELYEKFITLAISRYVEKLKGNSKLKVLSLHNLPEIYQNYMIELAKFAFETLKGDKIVFTAEEIKELCPNLSSANNDFQGLGLLKSTQYFSMKKIDNCVSYNFLHLSFQEYLAAYYINSLDPSVQFTLLKSTLFVEKYTNTWIMFTGLNKHETFQIFNYYIYGGTSCTMLKTRLVPMICELDPPQAFFKLINCCINNDLSYVTQILCFKSCEIELDTEINMFNEAESLVLSNQYPSVTIHWNKLYVSLCSCSKHNDQMIETFVIDKNIQEAFYDKIASQLKYNPSLSLMIVSTYKMFGYRVNRQQLIDGFKVNDRIADFILLKDCHLDDQTAEIVSNGIKCCNTSRIAFDGCTFSVKGVKLVFNALSCVDRLEAVHIGNMYFDKISDAVFSSAVRRNINLKVFHLNVCFNFLRSAEIKSITVLRSITNLIILDLSNCTTSFNCITKEIVDSISLAIQSNSSLQKLYLGNNKLETRRALKIVSALKSLSKLKVLDLSDNDMSDEVATDIAFAIENNLFLEVLRLGSNGLTLNGITPIAKALSKISTLKILDIRSNLVSDKAGDCIALVIKNNTGIEELYLGYNKLGAGALKIVKALKDVSSLKVLDLNSNSKSGIIADELAAVIDRNSLQKLWLAYNDLGLGVTVILEALSKITTLTALDLSGNDMPENAASFVASVVASNPSLEGLGLSNNGLKTSGITTIAYSLSEISTLKILNLKNTAFTEKASDSIASLIKSNTGIEELYLGYNKLGAGALKIVRALKDVSFLKMLDLSNSNTSGIIADELAAVIRCNNLQRLWLANNDLGINMNPILGALSNITTLIELNLSGNKMTDDTSTSLASAFKINISLEDLRISNNRLAASGIAAMAESLSTNSSLKILDLRNNLVTEEVAGDIGTLVKHNTGIKLLYLGNNKLGAGALKIVRALKDVSSLKVLDLNNNNTSGIIADELAAVIDGNSLQKLWLANNDLGSCARTFLHSLSKITTLTELDLSGNDMPEDVATFLASAVASNSSLADLRLNNNKLLTSGVVTIAESLSKNSSLKIFDIRNNLVTEQASDAIASVILTNNKLEQLYLGDNDLQLGMCTIVEALKEMKTLQTLNLNSIICCGKLESISNNSLSDSCPKLCENFIAHSLSKIETLRSLYLSGCCMKSKHAKDLAAVIESNRLLQSLQLKNNQLKTSGMITICKSLQQVSTLKYFNIKNNKVTAEAAEHIASVILSNNRLQKLHIGDNEILNNATTILKTVQSVSSLVVLYLSNMKMTDKVAGDLVLAISNNPLLEKLYLAGNVFSTTIIEIAAACKKNTKHLKALDLQCSSVNQTSMADLATVVGTINTLEALSLGCLNMNTKDKIIDNFVLNLKMVNLCHNYKSDFTLLEDYRLIELLNLSVQNSSFIYKLQINYDLIKTLFNDVDTLYIDVFNQQVTNNINFQEKTKQKLLDVDTTSFMHSLSAIQRLIVLNLEHSDINETAASELADKLYSNTVLQQLWLRGNYLNTAGALFILNSLERISTLKVLDLSFNNISYQSADNVAAVIYSNPTLEQLWLDGNGLLDTGVIQICRALKHVTKLRVLSVCSNGISDDSAEELSAAISSNNLLEDLLLGNNNLQSVGICKIVHSLNNLVRLRKLDLFHNRVTAEAADELAVTISNCYTLQELYLSDNMLGTTGAVKIFESLKHKSKLQVLTVSNNNITDEAVGELCFVLANNPRLQVLLIGGNKLQTDGVITIASNAKCENTIMHLLALCENDVSKEGKEQVKMMFSDNLDIDVYV